MLQGITEVLTAIGDFFASIVDFVSGLVDGLIQFVTKLGEVPAQINAVLGGFPAFFIAGVAILVAVMIVLRVVGRD